LLPLPFPLVLPLGVRVADGLFDRDRVGDLDGDLDGVLVGVLVGVLLPQSDG
jgi:hypothetical protein